MIKSTITTTKKNNHYSDSGSDTDSGDELIIIKMDVEQQQQQQQQPSSSTQILTPELSVSDNDIKPMNKRIQSPLPPSPHPPSLHITTSHPPHPPTIINKASYSELMKDSKYVSHNPSAY